MDGQWGTRQQVQGGLRPLVATPRRRPRFMRRRVRPFAIDDLMADLAGLEAARAEPQAGIDPEERALLVQLYRELVGTVEGPIVPFPVELMQDPAFIAERAHSAPLLDLDRFRARRHERATPGGASTSVDGARRGGAPQG